MLTNLISIDDYAIFILCYGRPEVAKNLTWKTLDNLNSKAKRYIVCSDDDPTISEYQKIFGVENVLIFNKLETEKSAKMDLVDCYHGVHDNKKGAVWARNNQYKLARKMGYRYFMIIDDDITELRIRYPLKTKKSHDMALCSKIYFSNNEFDELCRYQFNVLNSAPWLFSVGLAQGGDYIGGVSSVMGKNDFRFKSMNIFFFDTHKEERFYGRTNEDVNAYVVNGSRGEVSITLSGPMLDQLPTQKCSGGMTELYKAFGTYIKSLYSVILAPFCVSIASMGNSKSTCRIHHSVNWKCAVPMVVTRECCVNTPLTYDEVMHTNIKVDENDDVIEEKKYSFTDEICQIPPTNIEGDSKIVQFC